MLKHSLVWRKGNFIAINLRLLIVCVFWHLIFCYICLSMSSKSFYYKTQLLLFTNKLHSVLDRGSEIDCVCFDFSNPFEKVSHQPQLLKLSIRNIDPNSLLWILSFLTNRSELVYVCGTNSSVFPVKWGVPGGSNPTSLIIPYIYAYVLII